MALLSIYKHFSLFWKDINAFNYLSHILFKKSEKVIILSNFLNKSKKINVIFLYLIN
jgi:hypothetical protein